MSKYSSKDLTSIFGQKVVQAKEEQVKIEKDDSICEEETVDNRDTRGGIVTINSGSMVDYFKHKLPKNGKNSPSNTSGNRSTDSKNNVQQHIGLGFAPSVENTLLSNRGQSKDSSEKSDYAFDNPCLGLNSPTETASNIDSSFKNSAKKRKKEFLSKNADSHVDKIDKLSIRKRLKTEIIESNCKNGFTNPALNLDMQPNGECNGKEFEVSRAEFGVENCGLDLTDERSDRKRVTFNDHVEYSMDSVKRKRGKTTLDKFEVENKRQKKKRKRETTATFASNGFINEALDVETLCEEINDNALNEHKNKKIKKKKIHKTFGLETIQESPEREKEVTEIKESEDVTLNVVKNAIIDTVDKKSKKKKRKKQKQEASNDFIAVDKSEEADIEMEETIQNKEIKMDKSKEGEVTSKKRKKEKKKNKGDCTTESMKNDQCEIEIKSNSKRQENDHLVKETIVTDKNIKQEIFVKKSVKVETSLAVTLKKEVREPLDNNIIEKKKKNKECSEIEIKVEKEVSDKENAKEEHDPDIEQSPKKVKKRKKSKDNNVSDAGKSPSPNEEMANVNIKQESLENIDYETSSKMTKVIDVTDCTIHSLWSEKNVRMSKKILKTLFYRNLVANFPGSNIHEIKGYGTNFDNS